MLPYCSIKDLFNMKWRDWTFFKQISLDDILKSIFRCLRPFLTLQASPSSFSALWASAGFWMTRPPAFPEKSMATRLVSDVDYTHKHTHTHTHTQLKHMQMTVFSPCVTVSLRWVFVLPVSAASLELSWTVGSYTEAAFHTNTQTQTHTV